jgi:peptide/nickel transport system substrate-binding protein
MIRQDLGRRLEISRRAALWRLTGGAIGLAAPSALRSLPARAVTDTLTLALPNNPATLDPINSANWEAMAISQAIFENLVEVDVDGNLQPRLAVALPEISRDRLTYRFELRGDVHFQNGRPLSAEDVKYSFEYLLAPANKSIRRPLFSPIDRVVVEDPRHVRFELKSPYRPWLDYLTPYMGIFPKGSREENPADFFKVSPTGVGTGPAIFVEWRPNEYVRLERNPNYWSKPLPHWESLIIRIIPEDAGRIAALLTGQVDILSAPPPKDFAQLKAIPGIVGGDKATLGGWLFAATNTLKPPFDDVNLRKAVAHAIDRNSIAQNVYYGLVDPCSIPAPPRGWWFDASADNRNDYNISKAKEYLSKSKYANGAEFEMMMPSQPYVLDVRDAALVIQAQLAELGIKMHQRLVEQGVLLQMIGAGQHVAALQVWISPGEPSFMLDNAFNPRAFMSKASGYTSAELHALILKSFEAGDRTALKAVLSQIYHILASECPMLWLGYVHVTNLWRDSVKNFRVNQGLTMRVREVEKVEA